MDRTAKPRHARRSALTWAGAILLGAPAMPALAAPGPSARLVRCGAESCLRITGQRDDASSIVSVNGRPVPVAGERRWNAHLPVAVVREWSAANARTIDVSVGGPEAQRAVVTRVDLPIGLLADTATLAALVISVK